MDKSLDYCLVVGTEEIDWLLCDAYRRWRLLRSAPPIEPFCKQKRGMILSEGAGAIVLARLPRRDAAEAGEGSITIECAHPGGCYGKRAEAEEILKRIVRDLSQVKVDFVISSANGTFIDQAEQGALEQVIPDAVIYAAKPALGESGGASGLWQVILGVQALRHRELPPVLHADSAVSLRLARSRMTVAGARRAIILNSGVNQQVAGMRLALR
jgi:3-oxoacyl-[acyl-carrier-protein] synthase II